MLLLIISNSSKGVCSQLTGSKMWLFLFQGFCRFTVCGQWRFWLKGHLACAFNVCLCDKYPQELTTVNSPLLARLNNILGELLYYPQRRRLPLRPQMSKFYFNILRTSLFPNPMMDFVHVWYDHGYWSKILHSTIPTPIHNLKIKVTDLERLS